MLVHSFLPHQDSFQEEYDRTGMYPGTPIVPPRRPWTLLNWLLWALLLLYPLFKLLINMISSGSSLTLASFASVFIAGELVSKHRLGTRSLFPIWVLLILSNY